jgi:hypothetical protein
MLQLLGLAVSDHCGQRHVVSSESRSFSSGEVSLCVLVPACIEGRPTSQLPGRRDRG